MTFFGAFHPSVKLVYAVSMPSVSPGGRAVDGIEVNCHGLQIPWLDTVGFDAVRISGRTGSEPDGGVG